MPILSLAGDRSTDLVGHFGVSEEEFGRAGLNDFRLHPQQIVREDGDVRVVLEQLAAAPKGDICLGGAPIHVDDLVEVVPHDASTAMTP